MALAIGASTAIFSVLDAVMLHPLPVEDLDRLVALSEDFPKLDIHDTPMGPIQVEELRSRTDVFAGVAGVTGQPFTLTGAEVPSRVVGAATLGDFFGLFAQRPFLGRFYGADESPNAQNLVVVLSFGLWQELFGGDRAVVGKFVELDGRRYGVVGIAAAGFQYPTTARLWVPYFLSPKMREPSGRGVLIMTGYGRLREGVPFERASSVMHAVAEQWNAQYATGARARFAHDVLVRPFVDRFAGEIKPILFVLMAAVVVVLLIACANVGSLQLVRANGRSKELAVLSALGASRHAIVRHLLVESLVLALVGGALGIAVAVVLLRTLTSFDGSQAVLLKRAHLNSVVLTFTTLTSVAAGLAFGLAPALRAGRVDIQSVLKESARGSSAGVSRQRFLKGTVVVQVALALTLLLASGLVVRSLSELLQIAPGFTPENVLSMRVAPQSPSWLKESSARADILRRIRENIAAIPGVQMVGFGSGVPFGASCSSSPFQLPGIEPRQGDPEFHANFCMIDGDYFKTMGISLLRGRTFDETDRASAPLVAVIDEQLADRYFHGQDPIGRRIIQGREAEIIGVVRRVDFERLGERPKPIVYWAYAQGAWSNTMVAVVRTTLDERTTVRLVRGAVAEIEPRAPIYDIMTMSGRIDRSLGARRLAMQVLAGFAALSLVLAVLGIYGVLSYSTSQRAREIGIRMALGADPSSVARLVVRDGLAMVGLGLVAGVCAFLAVSRLLTALLYGIGPRDPGTIAGGVLLLATVAAAASYLPARRAARVDPVTTLRE